MRRNSILRTANGHGRTGWFDTCMPANKGILGSTGFLGRRICSTSDWGGMFTMGSSCCSSSCLTARHSKRRNKRQTKQTSVVKPEATTSMTNECKAPLRFVQQQKRDGTRLACA